MGLWIDSANGRVLDTKGVVRVDFCPSHTVDALREEFLALHPNWNETMKSGFYFSIFDDKVAYKKAILERMLPLIESNINGIFQNYKILTIIAQVKGVGANSEVRVHQDLTMVDESEYRSYTLWIPLEDSTSENGQLSFMEYSQNAFRGLRSHTIDYLFGNVEDYVLENSTNYPAEKGQAVIFDNATIHHSSANTSGKPRLSLAVSIIHKDAETQILHYERKKPFDGTLDCYAVPDDFWYRYENFEKERLQPPTFGHKIGVREGVQVLPYQRDAFIEKFERVRANFVKQEFAQSVKPVLKDTSLQQKLAEDGIVLMDFLSDEELEQLNALFHELHDDRADIPYDILYTCQHNPDSAYRHKMSDELAKILRPLIEQHFFEVKKMAYTFQIKGVGAKSALQVHQDWSFVKEENGFRTYTFWIPLVDSDESNGTISVLRGSHIPSDGIRGAGITPVHFGMDDQILPIMEPLKIKAGQLALFDSSLIHFSASNSSNAIRVSVMTNIIPEEAEVHLYFQNENDAEAVDEYLVPEDFFLHYSDFKSEYEKPPGFATKTRTFKTPRKKVTMRELLAYSKSERQVNSLKEAVGEVL